MADVKKPMSEPQLAILLRDVAEKLRELDREAGLNDRLFRERVRQIEKKIWLRIGEPDRGDS